MKGAQNDGDCGRVCLKWGALWLLLCVLVANAFFPEVDNDLWWHLKTGQLILAQSELPGTDLFSFTAKGLRWVNHEWCSDLIIAWIYSLGGSRLLLFLKGILCGVIGFFLFSIAEYPTRWGKNERGLSLAIFLALLLTLLALARGLGSRPQLVTLVGISFLLFFCTSLINEEGRLEGSRRRWWDTHPFTGSLIPFILFVLWANLHAGFIAGLALLFGHAGWRLLLNRERVVAATLWFVAGLAGSALNPYGPRLFSYIIAELGADHPITEWQAVHLTDVTHLPFILLSFLFLLLLGWRLKEWSAGGERWLREDGWRAVAALSLLVMAFAHRRHTPLFAVVAFSALVPLIRSSPTFFSLSFLSSPSKVVLGGAMCVLGIAKLLPVGALLLAGGGRLVYARGDYPVVAVERLKSYSGEGVEPFKMVLPLEWGGYALYHLSPKVEVSLDGRFAQVYPAQVVKQNFAFFRGDVAPLLSAHRPDFVISPYPLPPLEGFGFVSERLSEVAFLYSRPASVGTLNGENLSLAHHAWIPFP